MASTSSDVSSSGEDEITKLLSNTMNTTFRGLALALSYEVGIIESLTECETPRTSQEIADSKHLKERYVRELLNSLVCSHMIQVEKKQDGSVLYFIPRDHWPAFGFKNIPRLGMISSCAVRFQDLVQCIQKDGPYGVPYGKNSISTAALSRASSGRTETEIHLMLEHVPGLRKQLESGIDVVEVGSGRAFFISQLAHSFPKSHFVASEYDRAEVDLIQQQIVSQNLQNVTAVHIDILDIPESHVGKYDYAFVNDVIHDLPDAKGGLAGLRKLVKPGCYIGIVEIGTSADVMVNRETSGIAEAYTLSAFHCLAQAYQSADSVALGACWGRETARRYLQEQNYKIVSEHGYAGVFVLFVCQPI